MYAYMYFSVIKDLLHSAFSDLFFFSIYLKVSASPLFFFLQFFFFSFLRRFCFCIFALVFIRPYNIHQGSDQK